MEKQTRDKGPWHQSGDIVSAVFWQSGYVSGIFFYLIESGRFAGFSGYPVPAGMTDGAQFGRILSYTGYPGIMCFFKEV